MNASPLGDLQIPQEKKGAINGKSLPPWVSFFKSGPGIAILVALVIVAWVGWKRFAPFEVEAIQVTLPPARETIPVVTASGYIIPEKSAEVGTKGSGRIVYLHAEEGTYLHEGELFARLENSDLQAELTAALAVLKEAKKNWERAKALNPNEEISEQELTKREADLLTAQGNANLIQAELRQTEVRAPFSGTVLKKHREVGEMVLPTPAGGTATTSLITLADLSAYEAEVEINEANLKLVHEGVRAEIRPDADPDRVYQATLSRIYPQVDRQKATVKVKVKLLAPDPFLKADMGCRVTFLTKPSTGSAGLTIVEIPQEAVVQEGETAFVFIVDKGRVKKQSIQLGTFLEGKYQVTSGLTPGTWIITNPPKNLIPRQRVSIKNPE